MSYNGASIYQYQYQTASDVSGLGPNGPTGDVYTLPHLQLDAQASIRLAHGLSAVVYGLNLTDEVFGYYTGSTDFRQPARILQADLRRRASGIASTVKNNRLAAFLAAALLAAWPAAGAGRELKYVVIVSRHGVRSPTWDAARLNRYSAEPWPEWEVPPGNLTPHGRELIELMGSYYREWLAGEHLFRAQAARTPAASTSGPTRISARSKPGAPSPNRSCRAAESTSTRSRTARPIRCFPASAHPTPNVSLAAVRDGSAPIRESLLADHREALERSSSY